MRWLPLMLLLLSCTPALMAHPAILQYQNNGKTRVVAVTLRISYWNPRPSEYQAEEALQIAARKCGTDVVLGYEGTEPDGLSYDWAFICKDGN